jgi:hypothetical protein
VRFGTVGLDVVSTAPVHPSVYGAPDFSRTASGGFSSRRDVVAPQMEGDDFSPAVSGGVLLTIHPKLKIGALIRQGPAFDFRLFVGEESNSGVFAVPNTYSFGISIQPSDSVTIAADYARVEHSSLKNDFVNVIVGNEARQDQFFVDDVNEFHVGLEYIVTAFSVIPALRCGAWYEPAHGVRFERSPEINTFFNELFSASLDGGQALVHLTLGGGLSLNRHLEINAAGDVTSRGRMFSTSVILRF